jgi:hypothetical protein
VTSVVNDLKEVRDGEDTIASTRDARAPRNAQIIPDPKNLRLPILNRLKHGGHSRHGNHGG